MRTIAVLLAMTMSTTAFAQTASGPTNLTPGKPAGVHQAQMALLGEDPILIALGVAAIAAGIALASAGHSHTAAGTSGGGTTTTTTTTTTAP